MPVAGLPAALETILSSLLAADEPTSWKVDGEPGSVVVVVRFRTRDGQPLLTSEQRGYWRKKTPAQRRRDERRARQHRQKGEQRHCETFSSNVIDALVEKNSAVVHDQVENSRSREPPDYVTASSVNFDPSYSDGLHEVAQAASVDRKDDPPATETPSFQDQSAEVSSPHEVTIEDFERAMNEISQEFSRDLSEQMTTLRSEMAETRALLRNEESHSQVTPVSSASASALDPSDPKAITMNTCSSAPERSREGSRYRSTHHQTRSAVHQRVRDAASLHKPETRTPSSGQQPSRAARKT